MSADRWFEGERETHMQWQYDEFGSRLCRCRSFKPLMGKLTLWSGPLSNWWLSMAYHTRIHPNRTMPRWFHRWTWPTQRHQRITCVTSDLRFLVNDACSEMIRCHTFTSKAYLFSSLVMFWKAKWVAKGSNAKEYTNRVYFRIFICLWIRQQAIVRLVNGSTGIDCIVRMDRNFNRSASVSPARLFAQRIFHCFSVISDRKHSIQFSDYAYLPNITQSSEQWPNWMMSDRSVTS